MSEKIKLVTIQDLLDTIEKSLHYKVSFYIKPRNENNPDGKILDVYVDQTDGKIYTNSYPLDNVDDPNKYIVLNVLYDVIPCILTWCSIESVYYDYTKLE